jgi:nitrite reductase/ring-hydroxylating ferredoxin subunit
VESAGLTHVGSYERRVPVSLERVWENVLDWEHLPWLHRTSFSDIAKLDAGAWGWRARVGLQPAAQAQRIVLELVLERDALRYVARTLEGPGAGTEIWTHLHPDAPDVTGLRVDFHLPGVAPARAPEVLAGYRTLYTRLWDEDEAMMSRRARLLGDAAARAAFRSVEDGGETFSHAAVCPHALGPLDDAPVKGGVVRCPWHGYRFDLRSGRCLDAPHLRLRVRGRS